jgi:hypothetical protein
MAKKQNNGKLSDKNAFIAVAVSLTAVAFFVQFGVVF